MPSEEFLNSSFLLVKYYEAWCRCQSLCRVRCSYLWPSFTSDICYLGFLNGLCLNIFNKMYTFIGKCY
jgi:hypothetical protein